jgi:hypothetical protein
VLASWLKANVKGEVIVLLQSCGAGSAIYDEYEQNGVKTRQVTGIRELKGKQGDAAAARIAKAAVKAFAAADPGLTRKAKDGSRSTGDLRIPKFYVLAASRHRETSWGHEGSSPENYFVKWLLAGIGSAASAPADRNPTDGMLTLNELFSYIKEVGDTHPIKAEDGTYYQHVQRYPVKCNYDMFRWW